MRTDRLEAARAAGFALGMFERRRGLGKVFVDRPLERVGLGLDLGFLPGAALARGVLPLFEQADGFGGLLTRLSETDGGILAETDTLALPGMDGAQHPRAPQCVWSQLRCRRPDEQD
jgi:hypothetical protein